VSGRTVALRRASPKLANQIPAGEAAWNYGDSALNSPQVKCTVTVTAISTAGKLVPRAASWCMRACASALSRQQVGPGQIENLVATPAHHGAKYPQAKTLDLLGGDGRGIDSSWVAVTTSSTAGPS